MRLTRKEIAAMCIRARLDERRNQDICRCTAEIRCIRCLGLELMLKKLSEITRKP